MKYYIALTEEEIQRVCQAIPYSVLVKGFKKYSKDFSALMPGHRPQSVSEEAGRNLLSGNPRSNLSAKMVETMLSVWVKDVSNSVKSQRDEGKSSELAYINAFSKYNLSGCLDLYFRFSDESISEDRIRALSAGVDALIAERERQSESTKASVDRKKIEEVESKFTQEIKALKADRKQQASKIKELTQDLSAAIEKSHQIAALTQQKERLEQQLLDADRSISHAVEENASLSVQLSEAKELYADSKRVLGEAEARMSDMQSKLEKCQERLSEIEAERERLSTITYPAVTEERRPSDPEEFKEYFSYNLKCVGADTEKPYYSLLLSYLSDILFRNRPIICNHSLGVTLAACVSNSVYGNPHPLIVPYTKELTASDIRSILNSEHQTIVFDSFLGNYNELELLPLIRSVSGKVIFLTVEYDKSIIYLVPTEALCNCTYLNINKVPELQQQSKLDEDPSIIGMESVAHSFIPANRRMKRLCKEILTELGFPTVVTEQISSQMISEQKFIETLAFSILPYAQEALNCSPYNRSLRLQIYAGQNGKCPNKSLLMEWFSDE